MTFVLIATNPGEAIVHATPGCTDVIFTDSTRRGRGKIYAADEIRVTATALEDDNFPEIMATIADAVVPPNPTVVPLFPGLIHLAPGLPPNEFTGCCGYVPTQLPPSDRITGRRDLVTCGRYSARLEQLTGIHFDPRQRVIVDRVVASAGTWIPLPAPTTTGETS